MRKTSSKLLAALVLAGVLGIAGAAFAAHDVRGPLIIGDLIIRNNNHHPRAMTPPPLPPENEPRKGHRPPPRDGKRPPMSHDRRFDDRRLPPPDREPPREPRGFRPHIPPHRHPMARR